MYTYTYTWVLYIFVAQRQAVPLMYKTAIYMYLLTVLYLIKPSQQGIIWIMPWVQR